LDGQVHGKSYVSTLYLSAGKVHISGMTVAAQLGVPVGKVVPVGVAVGVDED
jgi:hypothetical protein